MTTPLAVRELRTDWGRLGLIATDTHLQFIDFLAPRTPEKWWLSHTDSDVQRPKRHPILDQTERELTDYFAGRRTDFSVPLELKVTPFQQEVLERVRAIPYGETRSYSEIAAQVKRPKAARAVGTANARNPIPLIVPCHRVVGANGLGGYGGGLDLKVRLLDFEQEQLG